MRATCVITRVAFPPLSSPWFGPQFLVRLPVRSHRSGGRKPPSLERRPRRVIVPRMSNWPTRNTNSPSRPIAISRVPWRELANLHLQVWQERGAAVDDRDTRVEHEDDSVSVSNGRHSASKPRFLDYARRASRVIHQMLKIAGSKLQPLELMKLRGEMIKSTRLASLLYPTKIELHARLAEASAEIGMYQDAVDEATEALRLDRITPHRDKKLPEAIRNRLEAEIPSWSENAAKNPMQRTP